MLSMSSGTSTYLLEKRPLRGLIATEVSTISSLRIVTIHCVQLYLLTCDHLLATTTPTVLFVQSNHLYGGGDTEAFHSRFPASVEIVSSLTFIPL